MKYLSLCFIRKASDGQGTSSEEEDDDWGDDMMDFGGGGGGGDNIEVRRF